MKVSERHASVCAHVHACVNVHSHSRALSHTVHLPSFQRPELRGSVGSFDMPLHAHFATEHKQRCVGVSSLHTQNSACTQLHIFAAPGEIFDTPMTAEERAEFQRVCEMTEEEYYYHMQSA